MIFVRRYKERLSGYRSWEQLSRTQEWLLFPENTSPYMSMDKPSLSNGELYTILTRREGHGGKGSLTAAVSGTKSDDVIETLEKISEEQRNVVQEVTPDLSDSMHRTVRSCFL
jgi:hypothetical protein